MPAVTFRCTPEDLLAAYRLKFVTAIGSRRAMRNLSMAGIAAGTIFGLGAWLWEIAPVPIAILTGFGYWALLLTTIFVSAYLRLPKQVRRIFAQQKSLHEETVVEWSAEGIAFRSERGHSRFDWSDYIRAVANRDTLILYQSEALINFIPTRVLSAAQVAEILRSV